MTRRKPHEVEVGDVVQITNSPGKGWIGALLTVSEVKTWGIQGYMHCIDDVAEPGSQAYLRPTWADIEWVGRAELVVGSTDAISEGEPVTDDPSE